MKRYVVSSKGMLKRYYKVVDTTTDQTIRVVNGKYIAEVIAADLNKHGPEHISGWQNRRG